MNRVMKKRLKSSLIPVNSMLWDSMGWYKDLPEMKRIQAIGNAKNLGFKIIDEASAEADLQKKNQKTK